MPANAAWAGSVLVTDGSAQTAIMGKLKEEAKKVIAGDGRDLKASLGPATSHAACERIHEAIETGIKEGAELFVDGRRPWGVPQAATLLAPQSSTM